MCEANKKDVMEINQNYLEGLHFHYVSNMLQVLDLALTDDFADQPVDVLEPVRKALKKDKAEEVKL
jgi:ATP-dependent Lon protease